MPRERYQRGSLERVGKRTKQWKGHWYVYVRQSDGSEKRVHKAQIIGRCAELNKGEAQRKLDAIIAGSGTPLTARSSQTFEQFIKQTYLPNFYPTWATCTKVAYGSQLRRNILPILGPLPIAEIRKMHVVEVVRSMEAAGRAHKTVKMALALMHAIFTEATENGVVPGNPVSRRIKIVAPRQSGAKPTLSLEQIKALFTRTTGRVRLFFRVLVLCGLRMGEALTLRWQCIEGKTLRVSESVDKRIRGPKSTKTELVRLVPAPADLLKELAAFRKASFFSADSDFIFGSERTGRYMSRAAAHKLYLYPAREATGLGGLLDFRICRRTLATRLKEDGVHVRDIQAILGHTTEATTSGHYIQPVEESQRKAVERMAALVI
jgi:integrase